MLPFLNSKKTVTAIIAKRGKSSVEVKPEVEAHGNEMDPGLKTAMEDLLRAIEEKSVIDMGKAFQAAMECAESSDADSDEAEV